MHKLTALVLGAACVLGVVGCGGSTESTLTGANNPRVEAVNAFTGGQTVDAWYGQDKVASALAFGQTSKFAIEPNTAPTFTFRNTATQGVIAQENTQTFELNSNYAVIGTNEPNPTGGGGTTPSIFVVRLEAQGLANQAQVRFVTATAAFGSVDVYVTAPGANITGGVTPTATLAASSLGTSTQLFALDPGTYEIRVFPANQLGTPLVDEQVTLTPEMNRTYVLAANQSNQASLIQLNDTQP